KVSVKLSNDDVNTFTVDCSDAQIASLDNNLKAAQDNKSIKDYQITKHQNENGTYDAVTAIN
ncbi:MAG: hypothetical protein ABIR06_08025, partial [Cyclobacteriaceae bacterium]